MAKAKEASPQPEPAAVGTEETPEKAGLPTSRTEYGDLPAKVEGYDAEDIGAGFEDMTRDDFIPPFMSILQKNSPQVEEENGAYLEGAKAGMIFNSVSNELHDGKTGIVFIPVHREHTYIEWIPRDQGGGFVAVFDPSSAEVQEAKAASTEFGKLKINDDNDLAETQTVYGLLVDEDGNYQHAVISFSSTQLKQYKKWMTMALSIQLQTENGQRVPAPLFAHRYRLKSRFQENKKGTWQGWEIGFDGKNAREARIEQDHYLYHEAKKFRQMVMAGTVKADMSRTQNVEAEGGAAPEEF